MKLLLSVITVLCASIACGQTFTNYPISSSDIAFEVSATQHTGGIWVAAPYAFTIGEGDKVSVTRSFDNGITWLTDTVYDDVVDPAICTMPDGSLIMVLQHMGFAGSVLELHRSTDGGDHFTYYSALPSSSFGDKPWVYADSTGRLYATWTEIDFGFNIIGFARSDDMGMSWDVTHEFLNAVDQQLSGSFFSVGEDDNCYLTWGEYTSGKIFFTKSSNNGDTWSEPVVIETMPTTDYSPMTFTFAQQNQPFIGVIASMAHSNNNILFVHSEDAGATWHTTLIDSVGTNTCGLVQNNGAIHIVYTHFPGDWDTGYTADTRYITSTDNGYTFSEPLSLLSGDADLIYSTYIGEYNQMHIGQDSELHVTWVRKTTDIGFTHTIIDIPADTSGQVDTTVAVSEIPGQTGFSITPNPANTWIKVIGDVDDDQVILFDHLGQRVPADMHDNVIDVSALPGGIYFVTINGQTRSFIKQ